MANQHCTQQALVPQCSHKLVFVRSRTSIMVNVFLLQLMSIHSSKAAPVNLIARVSLLAHHDVVFQPVKPVWHVWILPAQVQAPANLVRVVLETAMGDTVVQEQNTWQEGRTREGRKKEGNILLSSNLTYCSFFAHSIISHYFPLHPSLPHSLTPSLPHCLTPSLPHCLTPSLPHSLTPSLPHCLTPSLPHCLTPSLPHCLTPSLPHSLTASLPHSLTPSLPHSLTASLPHSLTASLPHSLTASLPHCLTASLPHCLTASLPHCLTPSLPHCLTPSLPHLPPRGTGQVTTSLFRSTPSSLSISPSSRSTYHVSPAQQV